MKDKGQSDISMIAMTIVIVGALIFVGGLIMHTFAANFQDDFRDLTQDTINYSTKITGTETTVDYSTVNGSLYHDATLSVAHEINTGSINVTVDNVQLASIDGTSPTEVNIPKERIDSETSVPVTFTFDDTNSNVTEANLTYTQYSNQEFGNLFTATTGNLSTGLNLMTIVLILVAASGLIAAIYGFVMNQ